MTLNDWIEMAMNVAVISALVVALIAALVMPLYRHRQTSEGGRSQARGQIDPRNDQKITPSV